MAEYKASQSLRTNICSTLNYGNKKREIVCQKKYDTFVKKYGKFKAIINNSHLPIIIFKTEPKK